MTLLWQPKVRLWNVPSAQEAQVLAEGIPAGLRDALAKGADAAQVVGTLGWGFREAPIGSDRSTIESLLVPLHRGGFSVVVNDRRSPSPERVRWLVAHEIGHSFFYEPGAPPRRIVPVNVAEERFCDSFADCLVGALTPDGVVAA